MSELPQVVPPTGVVRTQPKVLIAMPWLKHTNPITAFSVMGLHDPRRTGLLLHAGDAFVAHSRNRCADSFLRSSLEWMLMVDDDMMLPFGNAAYFNTHSGFRLPDKFAGMHTIDRLLSHGKTLVGGLYFGRHPHGAPMYSEGASAEEAERVRRRAPEDRIAPTGWVATGCMLIHRSVFEDIEKAYPVLARGPDGKGGNWFTSSEHELRSGLADLEKMALTSGPMTAELGARILERLVALRRNAERNSSLGMGEDVQFCVRAKQAGHQPYVDFGLVCSHIGTAHYGPGNTSRRGEPNVR